MGSTKNNYSMKKRGQAEIIGAIILIGVIVFGGFSTYEALSDNRYVVDISTNITYDLLKCSLQNVNKSNLRAVRDINGLDKEFFQMAECSK